MYLSALPGVRLGDAPEGKMKRLFATLICDIHLQWRNGFYYAIGFIIAVWTALLSFTPVRSLDLGWLMPAMVLNNLLITTFYFISGLVLLEKGEGSLQAQIVTPLRSGEYLAAKVITLAILALVQNLVLVLLFRGPHVQLVLLAAGIIISAAIFTLVGFIAVLRYSSINEYLLPSVPYAAVLLLPLLLYVGPWQSWLIYLHPVQAPLILMQAAFVPVAAWQLLYALGYALLWIGLIAYVACRLFRRFVTSSLGIAP